MRSASRCSPARPSRHGRCSGCLVGALEREERALPLAHREPHAPVASAVTRPALQHREPEDLAVEGLATLEVGALDGEVVKGERHGAQGSAAASVAPSRVLDCLTTVPGPLSDKRLLLVAEDRELAAVVASAAARLGAEVAGVKSGRAALAAVAARAPDAAVLDLPLPDVRGSELIDALARAGVATIVVSGVHRGTRAAEEVRRLGARDFFEKPFEVEAVVAAVARAVGADAPPLDAEAPDEVTGARPLERDEVPDAIAASWGPQDRHAAAAKVAGLAMPLPAARDASAVPSADVPPRPSGDLAEASVPRLCVALHVGQATGALTLERGPMRKLLLVERGVPVYAASNVAAERFAAICVRRGEVTPRGRRDDGARRAGRAARRRARGARAPRRRPARRARAGAGARDRCGRRSSGARGGTPSSPGGRPWTGSTCGSPWRTWCSRACATGRRCGACARTSPRERTSRPP